MWQQARSAWWTAVSPVPSLGKLSVTQQVGRQPVTGHRRAPPKPCRCPGSYKSLQDQGQQCVLGFLQARRRWGLSGASWGWGGAPR